MVLKGLPTPPQSPTKTEKGDAKKDEVLQRERERGGGGERERASCVRMRACVCVCVYIFM